MSRARKTQMQQRIGTHYDTLNADGSHGAGSCTDPARCDCECRHCMQVWDAVGRPASVSSQKRDPVRAAAFAWWRSGRPIMFTEADHLAEPTINCVNDAEKRLARAVAKAKRRAR